jgi:HAD superfamily hydrolase (TIGR01509 family)
VPTRGLVFDLYGTLVTRGEGWRAYRELIFKTLPPWTWKRARRAALTQPIASIAEFREHFGGRRGPPTEHYEQLLAEGLAAVELVEGCIATLERARERGLKLALLSNLASPYKQPVFELGLDRMFDELVFSCDVGMAKPSPEIFEHAAARLGLAPGELIMIGDSRGDDVRGSLGGDAGDPRGCEGARGHSKARGATRASAGAFDPPVRLGHGQRNAVRTNPQNREAPS